MARKCVTLITISAFVLFSSSCVTWSKKDVKTLVEPPAEGTAVLSVVKKSGQVLQFSKADPGRVRGFAVVGTARDASARRLDIAGPFPSIKQRPDGTVTEVVDANGQAYSVRQVLSREKDRMTIMASELGPVSIPLSEASVIEVRKDNALPIAAIVLGGLVVLPTLVIVLLHAVHRF